MSPKHLCAFLHPDAGLTHGRRTGTIYGPGKDIQRKEQKMGADLATKLSFTVLVIRKKGKEKKKKKEKMKSPHICYL